MNKVILFTIPHLYGGGAERVVTLWASQLAQTKRYDVHILVSGRVPNEYSTDKSVNIDSISATYFDYEKLSLFSKIAKRRALIKRIKPDFIISFLPHIQIQTYIATLGLKTKRIETIRVSPWVIRLNTLNKILFNRCLKSSHKIILQTQEQGDFFCPQIQRKCVVIPNPLDDNYKSISNRHQSKEVVKFMAAGRIVPQKNYSMMINAFSLANKEYPGITLDIFGTGDANELSKLTTQIEDLGLGQNIRFNGRCDNIIDEYLSHDAFLMTSDFEGMPNALLEAMASAMICLSTKCKTGPKDMIDHMKNGFLSPVGDINSFANMIKSIICMPQAERQIMGDAAKRKITDMCSYENTLRHLMNIFE